MNTTIKCPACNKWLRIDSSLQYLLGNAYGHGTLSGEIVISHFGCVGTKNSNVFYVSVCISCNKIEVIQDKPVAFLELHSE